MMQRGWVLRLLGLVWVAGLGACGAGSTSDGLAPGSGDYAGKVVISEVHYSPAEGEVAFVELLGEPNLDLHPLAIVGRQGDGTCAEYARMELRGMKMPIDGYFVIGALSSLASSDVVDTGADFQNGPDAVLLVDEAHDDAVVDAVAYGNDGAVTCGAAVGEGAPAPTSERGWALARDPRGSDTGDNVRDFCDREPSPGLPNPSACRGAGDPDDPDACADAPLPLPGELLVTEVMANGQFSSDWFEVYNPGPEPRCLRASTCILRDTGGTEHVHALGNDVRIDPGAHVVFGKDAFAAECGLALGYEFGSLALIVSGPEDVEVACVLPAERVPADAESIDHDGVAHTLIARASYDFTGRPKGQTLARCPDAASALGYGAEWKTVSAAEAPYCTSGERSEYGSPGAANPSCAVPVVPRGELLFTELNAQAYTANDWIELYSVAGDGGPRYLQGCTLVRQSGGTLQRYTFPEAPSIAVGAGGYVLLRRGGNCPAESAATCASYGEVDLPRTTDDVAVRLFCPCAESARLAGKCTPCDPGGGNGCADGQFLVDEVAYNQGGVATMPKDASLSLDPAAFSAAANDDPARWCPARAEDDCTAGEAICHGTPGMLNPACPEPPPAR